MIDDGKTPVSASTLAALTQSAVDAIRARLALKAARREVERLRTELAVLQERVARLEQTLARLADLELGADR